MGVARFPLLAIPIEAANSGQRSAMSQRQEADYRLQSARKYPRSNVWRVRAWLTAECRRLNAHGRKKEYER